MSSFAIGGTSVTFLARDDQFNEQWPTLLRTWDFEAYLNSSSDYATLASLLSYPVVVRVAPGSAGATMDVDIGGGGGSGTLTLDNVTDSPFTAALVRLIRPSGYPGGGRTVRLSFQETP